MKKRRVKIAVVGVGLMGSQHLKAIKISKMGMNVFFVNGKKPERIVKAIQNREFKGTVFKGKRNV